MKYSFLITIISAIFSLSILSCGPIEKPTTEEAIMTFLDEVEDIRRRGDTCLFIEKRGIKIMKDSSREYYESYGPAYVLRVNNNIQLWCTFGFIVGDKPKQETFFKTPHYGAMELDEIHHTYWPRIFVLDKKSTTKSVRLISLRMREVMDDILARDSAEKIVINSIGPKGMKIETTTYRNWDLYNIEQTNAIIDTLKFDGGDHLMKLTFDWIYKRVQVPGKPNEDDLQYDVTFYWDAHEGIIFEKYYLLNDGTKYFVHALPSCRQNPIRIRKLLDCIIEAEEIQSPILDTFLTKRSPQSSPSSP